MLENKASRSVLFIVITAVLRRVFTICCEQFTIVSQTYTSMGSFFRRQSVHACLDDSCLPRLLLVCYLSKNCNNPWNPIWHFCIGWVAEYWSSSSRTCWASRTCSYGPYKVCLCLLEVHIVIVGVTLILVAGTQGTLLTRCMAYSEQSLDSCDLCLL